jgi:prepilin-type N-terminal cleavage/methylation domain-containing protein
MKKRGFTLIEIIIVLVILGILSHITFSILSKVYENYVRTRELNKLNTKLDATMEIIATKLKDRVRNSVIITKYPHDFNDTDEDKVDFKPIADIDAGETEYTVLEWLNKDYEAKNGMWDSTTKHIQTGWSGFIDLGYNSHKVQDDPKVFELISPDSNFSIVKLIDENITHSYGRGVNDVFDENITTLLFAGIDGGGDIVYDINQSYGWYYNEDKNRTAKAMFAILGYDSETNSSGLYTDINISSITENNDSTLFSRYFLVRTAYALVPIENNETRADGEHVNDLNLTFVYNYQPWNGDWFKDGNRTLIANHITEIRFKKDAHSPIIRLYICVQSPNMIVDRKDPDNPDDNLYLTLCKEKAIF